MRIVGEWVVFDDGETRPIVQAQLLGGDVRWCPVAFVLDPGADRTVLIAEPREELKWLCKKAN